MPNTTFKKAKISAVSVTIPENQISIDSELQYYKKKSKVNTLKEYIGVDKRNVVKNIETLTSDLAIDAARDILNKNIVSSGDIDALILVTQTPDNLLPNTASYIHKELGLNKTCLSFDTNIACSGYVYGLYLAYMMVESGGCSNVLLLTSDTISKLINIKDRSVAPMFGDGASATLIQRSEEETNSYFSLYSDGNGSNDIMLPAGGFKMPISKETKVEYTDKSGNVRSAENLYMDGGKVADFTTREQPKAIKDILSYANMSSENIDYFLLHQANKFVVSAIAKLLNLPLNKVPSDLQTKYGNLTSTSIPVTICENMINKQSTLLLNGFGAGLSWGAAIINIKEIEVSKVRFYKEK